MPVHLESPYPKANEKVLWLRGNLHAHSTRSDGRLPAEEVIRRYADLGYDFFALSDHDVVSDYRGLDACGMVLLAANEVSGGSPHVLHVGARRLLSAMEGSGFRGQGSGNAAEGFRAQGSGEASSLNPEPLTLNPFQRLIDSINADSGLAILCHPNWEADFNHYPYEMLASLAGYGGIEIFNGGCWELEGSPLATDKWDRLLAAGKKVWGYANDDSHRAHEIGRAWNVVAARERSEEAIIEALRRGSFYASSGVTIERLECNGARVAVAAPSAQQIDVIGKSGSRIAMVKGWELEFDCSEVADPHIRIECHGGPGEHAWTQPIHIRGGVYEEQQGRLAKLDALKKSVLHAHHSDVAPKITGTLDDPLWQQAEEFSAFRDMRDGTPAPVKTRVRAIVAGGNIYFGFRCEEPELERIDASVDKALWMTDSVEVFLDTEGRGMSCWHVGINAGGAVTSGVRGASIGQPPRVRGRAGRYDDGERGWSAELVIPLDGVKVIKGTRWGLHICRNRPSSKAHYVWSWVGKSNHNREAYGSLIL